jgi:hypothetical protein
MLGRDLCVFLPHLIAQTTPSGGAARAKNGRTTALVSINSRAESSQLWHKILGSPSNEILHHLNLSSVHDLNNYDPCRFAKLHRLPFPEHASRSNELFDLIHSDVWGPAPVDSKKGFKYFISFIDDKSRTTWLYLLKSKSEIFSNFQTFCSMVKNQFNTTIKTFRSHNGTKYTNLEFQKFLQ